jgi:proteic killer suppression protein
VIESFHERATEDVFNGVNSAAARRQCPQRLWALARRKLDQLDSAQELKDLGVPPGNRLEPLRGDRTGQHGIRISEQYRICFVWTRQGPGEVEIVDYHMA